MEPNQRVRSILDVADNALHPWRRVRTQQWTQGLVRGPTDQEISSVIQALDEARDIDFTKVKETQLDGISALRMYVQGMLNHSDLPSLPNLRVKLSEIELSIACYRLQKERSNIQSRQGNESTQSADAVLLAEWASAIVASLTSKGVKEKDTAYTTTAHILTCLEAWDPIPADLTKDSPLVLALEQIVEAPSLPVVYMATPLRTRAQVILRQWTASVPYSNEELPTRESEEPFSNPEWTFMYHLDDHVRLLRDLETAAKSGDIGSASTNLMKVLLHCSHAPSELRRALGVPALAAQEAWQATLGSKADDVEPNLAALKKLVANWTEGYHVPPTNSSVVSYSYNPSRPLSSLASVTVRFQHATHLLGPLTHDAYRSRSDPRTWQTVSVVGTPMTPVYNVLNDFVTLANLVHRHPLMPQLYFKLSLSDAALNKPSEDVWEISPSQFVQGRLQDFTITDSGDVVIHYLHSGYNDAEIQLARMPEVHLRELPDTCHPPPQSWIKPSHPPLSDGPLDSWRSIPTLAFVGDGIDVFPKATYPPIISATVYALAPPAHAALGMSVYAHPLRDHLPTSQDCAPIKFRPPLTVKQARSLLGRTVQYEDTRQLNPLGGSEHLHEASRPSKKKRRTGKGASADPDANAIEWTKVYTAVVWGFDPERMELKVFCGWKVAETCRTLMVGTPNKPTPYPWLYPEERIAFAPRWIGHVVIPEHEPDTTEEPAIPENSSDMSSSGEDRLSKIIKLAPRHFEVGMDGNHTLLVGEIALHGSDPTHILHIDNCKPGIWESGYDSSHTASAVCWVRWIREGTIDLMQDISCFTEGEHSLDIQAVLDMFPWITCGSVHVDGGSVAIIAKAIAHAQAQTALTGQDDVDDSDAFLKMLALLAWEDGAYCVSGGVSVSTGADGAFHVALAQDSTSRVIAVKINVA